jgi:hypothetical protein
VGRGALPTSRRCVLSTVAEHRGQPALHLRRRRADRPRAASTCRTPARSRSTRCTPRSSCSCSTRWSTSRRRCRSRLAVAGASVRRRAGPVRRAAQLGVRWRVRARGCRRPAQWRRDPALRPACSPARALSPVSCSPPPVACPTTGAGAVGPTGDRWRRPPRAQDCERLGDDNGGAAVDGTTRRDDGGRTAVGAGARRSEGPDDGAAPRADTGESRCRRGRPARRRTPGPASGASAAGGSAAMFLRLRCRGSAIRLLSGVLAGLVAAGVVVAVRPAGIAPAAPGTRGTAAGHAAAPTSPARRTRPPARLPSPRSHRATGSPSDSSSGSTAPTPTRCVTTCAPRRSVGSSSAATPPLCCATTPSPGCRTSPGTPFAVSVDDEGGRVPADRRPRRPAAQRAPDGRAAPADEVGELARARGKALAARASRSTSPGGRRRRPARETR